MKKLAVYIAATVLAVSACSSTSPEPTDTPTPDQVDPARSAEPLTLRQVCPRVEDAIPGRLATDARLHRFAATVDRFAATSDLETRNALGSASLQEAAVALADASAGLEFLDASSAWRDSITTLADRCEAAGSSALQ